MATGTEARIVDALLERTMLLDIDPPADFALPNRIYEPVIGRSYIRVSILWAAALRVAVGQGWSVRHSGILQFSVFAARDIGAIDPHETASEIIAHFPWASKVRRLVTVHIGPQQPTARTPVQEPHWYQVPVDVPFYAIV